jgi:hypothetical protein
MPERSWSSIPFRASSLDRSRHASRRASALLPFTLLCPRLPRLEGLGRCGTLRAAPTRLALAEPAVHGCSPHRFAVARLQGLAPRSESVAPSPVVEAGGGPVALLGFGPSPGPSPPRAFRCARRRICLLPRASLPRRHTGVCRRSRVLLGVCPRWSWPRPRRDGHALMRFTYLVGVLSSLGGPQSWLIASPRGRAASPRLRGTLFGLSEPARPVPPSACATEALGSSRSSFR